MLEIWQLEMINDRMERAKRQMFGLEVDLRVTRRTGNKEGEQQALEMIRQLEAAMKALEEEYHA